MTRYTVRKYNPIIFAWSIYHQTMCQKDAYEVHADLTARGFRASIDSEYVSEGDEL